MQTGGCVSQETHRGVERRIGGSAAFGPDPSTGREGPRIGPVEIVQLGVAGLDLATGHEGVGQHGHQVVHPVLVGRVDDQLFVLEAVDYA